MALQGMDLWNFELEVHWIHASIISLPSGINESHVLNIEALIDKAYDNHMVS